MLDVIVKTLDGKNKSFSVPDDITVKEFKEKIAAAIDVAADLQRLIYQGRVLQDEKKLNDYDVNGKVIHAVARPPPSVRAQARGANNESPEVNRVNPRMDGSNVLVSTFTLPSEVVDPQQIQNIVQQTLTSMGDVGRNARVSVNAVPDGNSVNVQINLGQIGPIQVANESSNRIRLALRMLQQAEDVLNRLENVTESPMDTSEDHIGSQPAGATASPQSHTNSSIPQPGSSDNNQQPSNANENSQVPNDGGNHQPNGGNGGGSRTQRTTNQARTILLADVLTRFAAFMHRFDPHLRLYEQTLREDRSLSNEEAAVAQRHYNSISEIFHYLSHIYHHMSDLILDYNRPPPRTFRSFPAQVMPLVQQAIPIHVAVGDPRVTRQPVSGSVSESTSTQASHFGHTASTQTLGTVSSPSEAHHSSVDASTMPVSADTSVGQQAITTSLAETQTAQIQPELVANIGSTLSSAIEIEPGLISVSTVTAEIVADDSDNDDEPMHQGYHGISMQPTQSSTESFSSSQSTSQTQQNQSIPTGVPPFMPGFPLFVPGVNVFPVQGGYTLSGHPSPGIPFGQAGTEYQSPYQPSPAHMPMPGSTPTTSTVQVTTSGIAGINVQGFPSMPFGISIPGVQPMPGFGMPGMNFQMRPPTPAVSQVQQSFSSPSVGSTVPPASASHPVPPPLSAANIAGLPPGVHGIRIPVHIGPIPVPGNLGPGVQMQAGPFVPGNLGPGVQIGPIPMPGNIGPGVQMQAGPFVPGNLGPGVQIGPIPIPGNIGPGVQMQAGPFVSGLPPDLMQNIIQMAMNVAQQVNPGDFQGMPTPGNVSANVSQPATSQASASQPNTSQSSASQPNVFQSNASQPSTSQPSTNNFQSSSSSQSANMQSMSSQMPFFPINIPFANVQFTGSQAANAQFVTSPMPSSLNNVSPPGNNISQNVSHGPQPQSYSTSGSGQSPPGSVNNMSRSPFRMSMGQQQPGFPSGLEGFAAPPFADPYLPCYSRHFANRVYEPMPAVNRQRLNNPLAQQPLQQAPGNGQVPMYWPPPAHQQMLALVNNAIASVINQIQANDIF